MSWNADRERVEVEPFKDRMVMVEVPMHRIALAQKFAEEMELKKKGKDYVRNRDPKRQRNRDGTGKVGEMAVEVLLDEYFADLEVGPSSAKYNVADLEPIGLDVGVKTKMWPSHPIVNKYPSRPEIICFRSPRIINRVMVAGLATVEVLQKYQDDSLLNKKWISNDKKTGFYGIKHLKPFKDRDELECLLNGEEIEERFEDEL
jgi:hypothetical protein